MNSELALLTIGLDRIRNEWAVLRYENAFRKFMLALKTFTPGDQFNPEQPRDWHGRWTAMSGASQPNDFPDMSSWGDYAGRGHHYISREVFKGYNLSDEAKRVFEGATTGHLGDNTSNQYDKVHREYSKAVGEAFKDYLLRNNIEPGNMTKGEAEKFVEEVKRSSDPRIRQLNMRIWMREIMRGLRLFRGKE